MHGYPVMQVVQYVPPCTWGPPTDTQIRPPSTGMSFLDSFICMSFFLLYLRIFLI